MLISCTTRSFISLCLPVSLLLLLLLLCFFRAWASFQKTSIQKLRPASKMTERSTIKHNPFFTETEPIPFPFQPIHFLFSCFFPLFYTVLMVPPNLSQIRMCLSVCSVKKRQHQHPFILGSKYLISVNSRAGGGAFYVSIIGFSLLAVKHQSTSIFLCPFWLPSL